MKNIIKWVSRIADGIAAALLAAIFFTFLIQIASRYFPKIIAHFNLADYWPWLGTIAPLGWTLELIAILWVWVIFFSCALVVREIDHVKFDIIYLAVPRKIRAAFAIIGAVAIAAGMIYAFLPTLDYIDWMKRRGTATVENPLTGAKISMRTIFSIYIAFMLTVAVRYVWMIVNTIRSGPPQTELEAVLEAQSAVAEQQGGAAS